MNKIALIFLCVCYASLAQKTEKVEYYNFGHNGMEFVARSGEDTIIISTFNSKMTIREEIAKKLYRMYKDNKLTTDTIITIDGIEANVTGKCIIRKKNKLTLVDFYYESVLWDSGLKEIYKNRLG